MTGLFTNLLTAALILFSAQRAQNLGVRILLGRSKGVQLNVECGGPCVVVLILGEIN